MAMKTVSRNRIVAVDKDDNVILGPPPNWGYDPMPYATALQCVESDIKTLARIEQAEEITEAEVKAELVSMLQIGKKK